MKIEKYFFNQAICNVDEIYTKLNTEQKTIVDAVENTINLSNYDEKDQPLIF